MAGNAAAKNKNDLSEKKRRTNEVLQDSMYKPPQIYRHPVGKTVRSGSNVRLVVEASGVPAPKYRWYRNGAPLEAIGNVLNLPKVKRSHAGAYHAVATNVAGADESRMANIIVNDNIGMKGDIIVSIDPAHVVIELGKEFQFTAKLENCNDKQIFFQWYKDGKKIKGAQSAVLRVREAKAKYVGTYTVTAKVRSGLFKSEAAKLDLKPAIATPPRLNVVPPPAAALPTIATSSTIAGVAPVKPPLPDLTLLKQLFQQPLEEITRSITVDVHLGEAISKVAEVLKEHSKQHLILLKKKEALTKLLAACQALAKIETHV